MQASPLNIRSVTPQQWSATVEQVSHEKIYHGHTMHYINERGDIAVFQDKNAAKKAGFSKLKLPTIISISKNVLNKTADSESSFRVAQSLRKLAVWKENKLQQKYKSVLHALNPIAKSKFAEVEKARSLSNTLGATRAASAAELSKLATAMKTVKTVQRSKEGFQGVFITNSQEVERRYVCKLFTRDPNEVRFSEHLMHMAGFRTAQPYFLPMRGSARSEDVELGELVGAKINELGPEGIKNVKDLPDTKRQQHLENLQFALKHGTHVQVGSFVEGKSLTDLHPSQLEEALKDEDFLKELGKMMVIDAFLGNNDRIQPGMAAKPINMGNIMAAKDNQGKWHVVLIDNEAKMDRDFSPVRASTLRSIFGHEGVKPYVNVLCQAAINQKAAREKEVERNPDLPQPEGRELHFESPTMAEFMLQGAVEAAKFLGETFASERHLQTFLEASHSNPDMDVAAIQSDIAFLRRWQGSNRVIHKKENL